MKKILLLILSLLTALSLASCGGNNPEGPEGEGEGGDNPANQKTYTITVLDGTSPVSGATVCFLDVMTNQKKMVKTGADGKAMHTAEVGTTYIGCVVSVPDKSEFNEKNVDKQFDSNGNLTINIGSSDESGLLTYTIYVKDKNGNPQAGIKLQICQGTECKPIPEATDADGKVIVKEREGDWEAKVFGEENGEPFNSDRVATIIIEE